MALYGDASRWAMTERGRDALRCETSGLAIGPSSLAWDGDDLTVAVDEVTAPLPSRIRGTVRVRPTAVTERTFTLDAQGHHRWWPIAPQARVEVALHSPSLRWTGPAYLDANDGDAPLEETFSRWDWCAARLPDGAAILYDVEHRGGGAQSVAIRVDGSGAVHDIDPPPHAGLTPTRWWRVPRRTRADIGHPATVKQTLEDAPFYARSVLDTTIGGQRAVAVHESLSLDRFRNPIVQAMLPFRMPRRAGR